MSEMVERAARAMLRAAGDNPDLLDCTFETFRHLARAAIEAMREPTTVMRLTGAITLAMRIDGTTGSNESLEVWESMIDGALK